MEMKGVCISGSYLGHPLLQDPVQGKNMAVFNE